MKASDCVYSKLRVTIALMLILSHYVRSTGEHLRLRRDGAVTQATFNRYHLHNCNMYYFPV